MQRSDRFQMKMTMVCTRCTHRYSFVVEKGKKLIHDKTKCPECKSLGVPVKDEAQAGS